VDPDIDRKQELLGLPSRFLYHFHLSSTIPERTEFVDRVPPNEHFFRYDGIVPQFTDKSMMSPVCFKMLHFFPRIFRPDSKPSELLTRCHWKRILDSNPIVILLLSRYYRKFDCYRVTIVTFDCYRITIGLMVLLSGYYLKVSVETICIHAGLYPTNLCLITIGLLSLCLILCPIAIGLLSNLDKKICS
jgi:hypothetical protein